LIGVVIAAALFLTACGGGSSTSATVNPSTSASLTASPINAAGSGAPSQSAANFLFSISGTFLGQSVEGNITPAGLACDDVGVASSPLPLVLWSGTIGQATNDPSKQASGLLRGPAGTYDGPGGKGVAGITVASDQKDAPTWTSGTFTINPGGKSGTVDLVFGNSPDQVALKGTFACS
jgi:hypothetical protein